MAKLDRAGRMLFGDRGSGTATQRSQHSINAARKALKEMPE